MATKTYLLTSLIFTVLSFGCGKDVPDTEPPEGDADTDTDSDSDTDADADTDADTDAVILTATSPEGIQADVSIPSDVIEALGVDPDELEMEFLEHREPAEFDPELIQDLGGGMLVLQPEGLEFPYPLELELTVPDSVLQGVDNFAQVFVARCQDGRWGIQAIHASDQDSLTIHLADTHDTCPSSSDLLPPAPFSIYGTGGIMTGFSGSYVDTVSVDRGLELERLAAFTLEGNLEAGVEISLAAEGATAEPEEVLSERDSYLFAGTLSEGLNKLEVRQGGITLWSQTLVVGVTEDPEAYRELAEAWAPVFQFAEGEQYVPLALDSEGFFFDDVWISRGLGSTRSVELSPEELPIELSFLGNDANVMIDGDSPDTADSLQDMTIYYSVHLLNDGALALQYWAFYKHDPKTYDFVTSHNRDRESVVVVLEASGELRQIVYAGHGADHWMKPVGTTGSPWDNGAVVVAPEDAALACERPVVFVALGSHAMYPRADEYSVSVNDIEGHYWPETAGGGDWGCPDGFSFSGSEAACGTGENGYTLEPLPTSEDLYSGAALGMLLFSGDWVQGPFNVSNSTFPPNLPRYSGIDTWLAGLSENDSAVEAAYADLSCTDAIETDCDDGLDGDGDGQVDCDDPDCAGSAGCGPVVSDHEGISMVLVPAGTFTMGSPTSEEGRDSDETEHEVTLTQNFWMGVYEVTQAQFEGFMGYQPSYFDGCPDCPAENMDWYEAAAFANAVSASAGLAQCYACSGSGSSVSCSLDSAYATPYDCAGYRLPTEAEWEYAARAGTTSAFSNGGNLYSGETSDCGGSLLLDNGTYLDDIAWYCGNESLQTEEVGGKDPNPWGLYDMHGNVWEWCHDWYESSYSGTATNPWGASSGSYRVNRGGSWYYYPLFLRSASRYWNYPSYDNPHLGFRLARSE
jgi:formylglycine-generating enzyme required for sulfatase activity